MATTRQILDEILSRRYRKAAGPVFHLHDTFGIGGALQQHDPAGIRTGGRQQRVRRTLALVQPEIGGTGRANAARIGVRNVDAVVREGRKGQKLAIVARTASFMRTPCSARRPRAA